MIIKRIEKDDEIIATYDSSNILASKLNTKTNNLTIIFKQGRQYLYENVSKTDYMRFEIAESQGKVLNSHIKQYSTKQLEQINPDDIIKEVNLIKKEELINLIARKKESAFESIKQVIKLEESSEPCSLNVYLNSLSIAIKSLEEYKQIITPVDSE